jgi:hypothetical protein
MVGVQGVRLLGAAALLIVLGACGDTDGSGLSNEDRVADFAAMSDRLGSLFNTAYTGEPGEVPSSGTANFQGFAGFVLDTGAVPLTLIGDTAMSVDFGSRKLTGEMTNFFGDSGGALADYTGKVAIVGGEIGFDVPRGTTVPNDVRFGYAGALSGQGNLVELDGAMSGKLKGTPIRGILANTAPGETEILNGSVVGVTGAVAAEIQ